MEDVASVHDFCGPAAIMTANDNEEDTHTTTTTKARAIFLTATYGEGEPTDNSNEMVQLLKEEQVGIEKEQPSNNNNVLEQLEFSVFGLGNKQYEQYNAMGKFFYQALQECGAKPIAPLGLGDDDADLEGDFETWKDQLWETLKERYCKDAQLFPLSQSNGDSWKLPKCEYSIHYHKDPASLLSSTSEATRTNTPLEQVHGSGRPFFTAVDCPVTQVQELRTPADGGSTKHVELDISKTASIQNYITADNLAVLPLNSNAVVERVAQALGYDLDAVFSLKAGEGQEWHGAPFPMPLTVRECLTRYLDLTNAPRRSDLKLLTQYATDKLDRQFLLRLSSKEGKVEYKEKIMQAYVGIVDLVERCPSLQIPLEHLCSLCHWLLPRYYTIASSSSVHPQSIHITVAVTKEDRPGDSHNPFEGVCSTFLAKCRPGQDYVRVLVRPSTFRLPKDTSKPILMIGPGTGIAPMRALMQERVHQTTTTNNANTVGKNILYFGCKRSDQDYLYQDELEAWKAQGHLELHVAFSRANPLEKVYVQHLLEQQASETYSLIHEEGAYIYVCGGVKMGHDVTETLKQICVEQGAMSFDQAKDYLSKLAADGRFVQELWA